MHAYSFIKLGTYNDKSSANQDLLVLHSSKFTSKSVNAPSAYYGVFVMHNANSNFPTTSRWRQTMFVHNSVLLLIYNLQSFKWQ